MLLNMTEVPLNDFPALGQLLLRLRLAQSLSHRLHRRGVRPNLNHPSTFAVLAQSRRRTIDHMTAILPYPVAFLLSLAPIF
jgi:hypothetical protein